MAKIIHERDKCIGCGACATMCPEFWEMSSDGKSTLKGSKKQGKYYVLEVKEIKCNEEAANVCPVQIIKIEKE